MTTVPASALVLDHVGVITRDLDAGARCWERLGFMLSPLSRQRGAVPGAASIEPWASANRCAIFEKGYLELIGIVDPAAHNPWRRFIERFEGIHLAALRCEDADRAYARLRSTATFLDAPIARERKLEYRGSVHTMRFRNIFSRDAECPEGRYIVIEHQTPELLWQPELMTHANGAVGLEEVVIVTDDVAVAQRARALDGVPKVMGTARFAAQFGFSAPDPSFAAITVSFRDLGRAIELLRSRGVVVQQKGSTVWLAPEDTNGLIMQLVEHTRSETR